MNRGAAVALWRSLYGLVSLEPLTKAFDAKNGVR